MYLCRALVKRRKSFVQQFMLTASSVCSTVFCAQIQNGCLLGAKLLIFLLFRAIFPCNIAIALRVALIVLIECIECMKYHHVALWVLLAKKKCIKFLVFALCLHARCTHKRKYW